jgi:N-acetylglucosaminyl-diphospho-decaprenol L-rhamnosyltransferase
MKSYSQPLIGVAIVSYNTRDLLRDCLASLMHVTVPLRIVVVDHASPDGSANMVRNEFPHVELIARSDNPGFAGGTNMALRQLGFGESECQGKPADLALLLNPDTIVHAGAIEAMVAFLAAHPRVGMVGPRLLNADGSRQAAAFRFPTLSMTALDLFPPGEVLPGRLYDSWWHGRYAHERADLPFAIDHPLGACILARRAVLEEIGLLDEGYYMYAEEVDWCYRARRAGWAIWQVPQARVTHIGGAATRQVRPRMQIVLYTSRMRFFRLHYPPYQVQAQRLLIRAGAIRGMLMAIGEYLRGEIPRETLQQRMWAYGGMWGV